MKRTASRPERRHAEMMSAVADGLVADLLPFHPAEIAAAASKRPGRRISRLCEVVQVNRRTRTNRTADEEYWRCLKQLRLTMRDLRRAFYRAAFHGQNGAVPRSDRRSPRPTGLSIIFRGRNTTPHYFKKPASALHVWLATECGAARKVRGVKVERCRASRRRVDGRQHGLSSVAPVRDRESYSHSQPNQGLAAAHLNHIKREIGRTPTSPATIGRAAVVRFGPRIRSASATAY